MAEVKQWVIWIARPFDQDRLDVFVGRRPLDGGYLQNLTPKGWRQLDSDLEPLTPIFSVTGIEAKTGFWEALAAAMREAGVLEEVRDKELEHRAATAEGSRDSAQRFADRALDIIEKRLLAE